MQDKKKELHPMNKIKKVVLISLTTLTLIFAILYTIELVDKKVNKEEYAKIDLYLKSHKALRESKESRLCDAKVRVIFNETLFKVLKDESAHVDLKYQKDYPYNDAISACRVVVDNFNTLEGPKNISNKKAFAIKDMNSSYINAIPILYINSVEYLKKCHGDNKCIFDFGITHPTGEFVVSGMDFLANSLEVKKRHSIKSLLFDNFAIIKIRCDIKLIKIRKKERYRYV